MKTTPGDIIVLNMSIKNYDVRFLRYGARLTSVAERKMA